MKKKTICFIIPKFLYESQGGAELQSYYIARELINRGWEAHYIREYMYPEFPKNYEKDGIFIHSIPFLHPQLRFLNTTCLFKVMQNIMADVWYCRATISYLFPVYWNARKLRQGKVVWACSHDKEIRGVKAAKPIIQMAWNLNQAIFRAVLPRINHILLQTQDQKNLLKKHFRLSGRIIYNAHPKVTGCSALTDNQTIIWVGRLQTWKRPELFIALANHFKKKPYQFIAVGIPIEGCGHLEASLRETDKALPNFKFTGELQNAKVCRLITQARLLVCTSDHEGFSNTFIEAWARGVPVISLKVDPDNLLTQKKLGVVSKSFEQLCKDVEHFMEDDRLWSEVSQNCLHFFNTHMTIDRAVSELESVLGN
ncbi:MAG: glycosyltransferase family 4 protein [Desulfotignum sp.]|nr:glycosyltransferase family 4 protein [Desulfotignum sp.]MCF8086443.1 glycosyltransferase family 4 protein [Desulfotignum sp.]MCF8135845.1 glycosyltransferase family 4 protein [Desulfotignum sp.]